jgi:hypothetical protein
MHSGKIQPDPKIEEYNRNYTQNTNPTIEKTVAEQQNEPERSGDEKATEPANEPSVPPPSVSHKKVFGLNVLKQVSRHQPKVKERKHFTQDELLKYWEEFIEALKLKGEKRYAALLASVRPVLEEENIIVEFDNTLSIKDFNSFSERFLKFLQDKLHNHYINFKVVQVEPEEVEKTITYYTKEERIRRLMELNPDIKELMLKLGLE